MVGACFNSSSVLSLSISAFISMPFSLDDDLKNRGGSTQQQETPSWTGMQRRVNPTCCLYIFLFCKKSTKLRVTVGVPLFLINFANSAHRRVLAPSYEGKGERVEFPCPGKREKVGGCGNSARWRGGRGGCRGCRESVCSGKRGSGEREKGEKGVCVYMYSDVEEEGRKEETKGEETERVRMKKKSSQK